MNISFRKLFFRREQEQDFWKSHILESVIDAASYCQSIWQNQDDLSIYYAKTVHIRIMILSLENQEKLWDANVRKEPFYYIQILSLIYFQVSLITFFESVVSNLHYTDGGSQWLLWLPWLLDSSVPQQVT